MQFIDNIEAPKSTEHICFDFHSLIGVSLLIASGNNRKSSMKAPGSERVNTGLTVSKI